MPDYFYRKHRYCRCTVEFLPGTGKSQDVCSKKWSNTAEVSYDKNIELIENTSYNYKRSLNKISKQNSVNSVEKLRKHISSEVLDMDNFDDINKYIFDKYGYEIKSFQKRDLDQSKIVFGSIDALLEKYPEAKNAIKSIKYNSRISTYGQIRDRTLHVGKDGFNLETIAHELGHMIDIGGVETVWDIQMNL